MNPNLERKDGSRDRLLLAVPMTAGPSLSTLPRRRWDDPSLDGFLRRAEPVIITGGCPLCAALVGRWTFEHLAHMFDGSESLQVHFSRVEGGSEADCTFARVYGSGLGTGGVQAMSFRSFVDAVSQEGGSVRHYLAAPLVRNSVGAAGLIGDDAFDELDDLDDPDASTSASSRALRAESYYSGPISEELTKHINWAWLMARARATGAGSRFDMCQLWAGTGCGATPLHFDALSNFFAQVLGSKRVTLFPPSASFAVGPYPVGHPKDNYAMARVEPSGAVDTRRFPSLAWVHGFQDTIEAGEVHHHCTTHLAPPLSCPAAIPPSPRSQPSVPIGSHGALWAAWGSACMAGACRASACSMRCLAHACTASC